MKAKQLIYLTILLLLIISCQSHLFRQESSDKMVFKNVNSNTGKSISVDFSED
jgi:hypothetical protein